MATGKAQAHEGQEKRRQGAGGAEARPAAVTTTLGVGSEEASANGTDGTTVCEADGTK